MGRGGAPPPRGWGPGPPRDWPPPSGLPGHHGPPFPGDWGPPPPGGWGPPPPGEWAPPPPEGWDPRGPPPPDWDPRGPPPPGWGLHPDDWLRYPEWRPPYPEDWRPPYPEDWRPHYPEDWRPPHPDDLRPLYPEDWGPRGWGPRGWGPPGPPEPWGPPPGPPAPVLSTPGPPGTGPPAQSPAPVPLPPVGIPPPGTPYPVPISGVPPVAFPAFPPPGWTGEAVVEEPLPNPPPEQPEWIKALISAPPTDSTPQAAKDPDPPGVTVATSPDPEAAPVAAVTATLDSEAETAPVPNSLGLLGKRTFEKPPPGRMAGTISDIGPTFGRIETEDLEKFTFRFDAFFGNPKAMTVGVRVHFTPCKDKIATDVKVAPGGTETVDPEILEAVVTQPIAEPPQGERPLPGQVTVQQLKTTLAFDRKDSSVTLLKGDQVLLNVLSDVVFKKRKATNIKPTIPGTFSHTQETREKGVIVQLQDDEGVLRSEQHGELPFDITENLSDLEFTTADQDEEVEFTVAELKGGKRAIRIQRVREPLLLALGTTTENKPSRGQSLQLGPSMKLDTELYEGVVNMPFLQSTGFPGQIHANIGTVVTNVPFDLSDCSVTLLKNDHVLINLLVDAKMKRRATNVKPKVPFTFSHTKEKREQGIITRLSTKEGVLTSEEHGQLHFSTCENFSDTEFDSSDINKEVEFTVGVVNSEKRAIRLMRLKKTENKVPEGQNEVEGNNKKQEAKDPEREAERKKKEEVAAALEAAKCKWTPFGFKMRDPNTQDDISKERFEGTVLKSISKYSTKIKKVPQGGAEGENVHPRQLKVKEEKDDTMDAGECAAAVKEEAEEVKCSSLSEVGGGAAASMELGRLVMTVDGQQKQLPFGPIDLLSRATMLIGDKVRFNIATHRDTKEERATYVEILPDSFEESTEQRQHGIVIEFMNNSGFIKCTENPQLYFYMSEVIEKKRLELNEKVEFSIAPLETAEGKKQAIRIKRFTDSVFLPVRKLGGVGTNKGKMTIKLTKASGDTEKEKTETDKLKAVVKNLRKQDRESSRDRREYSARRRRDRSSSRSKARSRSRSRSPPKDQFGRIIKSRQSASVDRERKRSRRSSSRSRVKSSSQRSHTRSSSRSRSRSRSAERIKDRSSKRRSRSNREHEESHSRRRGFSPPSSRHVGVMDDELARKKRELDNLNEMIAYKKLLVDTEPGQRTCIDYDHGRIPVPLAEYKPVRSILKKQPDGPEYSHRSPQSYSDPYYERPLDPYQDRRYRDPYSDAYKMHPYGERHYEDRPYADSRYDTRLYGAPPRASQHYTDRYDVYDEPYEVRYPDAGNMSQSLDDPYGPIKRARSPDPGTSSPFSQAGQVSSAPSQPPLSHAATTLPSHIPFRPPSPTEPPPRSPSPRLKPAVLHQSPPREKPPLDRFLDMLNKKVDVEKTSEPVFVNDDLLPHERALQDGKGFSRIVGLAQDQPRNCLALEEEKHSMAPDWSSAERTKEEPKNLTEPYDKIQSLLRTVGLKLSTGDVSKLATRGQETLCGPRSSSAEKESLSFSRDNLQANRSSSTEVDLVHSSSPARCSSLDLRRRQNVGSEYEGFLDEQELETLKKAQQLQSLAKSIETVPSVKPSAASYLQSPTTLSWTLGVTTQMSPTHSSAPFSMSTQVSPAASQLPQRIGPVAGPSLESLRWRPDKSPPPDRLSSRKPPGPPPGLPLSRLPSQSPAAPARETSSPSTALTSLETSGHTGKDQSAISTTVARCLKVIETVKSLAEQPAIKPVKSVQFSLPSVSPSVSAAQSSADGDDDIKIKQKEKLDLYNQRILEKREQKHKELQAQKKAERNKDGALIAPGRPMSIGPKNVWICGHSLVYWAESRAKSPEVGMQLGMDPSRVTIWWKGTQGMTWPQLLPQLHQLKVTWPNPDVLIMHLGGNDLSTDSPTDLLASVKKDLTSMRSIFPHCALVWSNILPRRVWRHSDDSHEVDLVRSTVNRRIHSIISELGGTTLPHDNIRCGANTGLYRADGVHLSPRGLDVFNLNMQDFLEKWESTLEKS